MSWSERRIIVVTGIGGSGKSTLVKDELLFDFDRVIVNDYKNEYNFLERFRDFDAMASSLAGRRRFMVAWQGGNRCEHRRAAEAARLVGDKPNPEDARCPGYIEHISTLSLALGSVCNVVEEAIVYDMPEGSQFEEAVLRTGREYGVSWIAVCQRPQHLHPNFRGNSTDVYALLNHEPSAIEWCRPMLGRRAAELPMLSQFRGLHWSAGQEIREFSVGR